MPSPRSSSPSLFILHRISNHAKYLGKFKSGLCSIAEATLYRLKTVKSFSISPKSDPLRDGSLNFLAVSLGASDFAGNTPPKYIVTIKCVCHPPGLQFLNARLPQPFL